MVISRGVAQKSDDSVNRTVANRYLVRKKLGVGQYGTVYLVEDEQSLYSEEKLKVLKEIHVGEMPPDETIDAMREAKLQAKLDHIGVVKCFNNFLDKDFFCIISEYCDGGDLGQLIEKAKRDGARLSETTVLDYFCQIVLAVRYMHQKQILHRDLKPRNIFIKDNTCRLGDFGISRVLMGTADMASTFIGTPYYMSPECLKHEGYDAKSDMWSVGVILYELCTFEHCFDGESMMSVMYKITQGKIPKLPQTYCAGLQNIFERLVQRNQQKRYTASQVLRDPFIGTHLQKMKKRVSENWVHAIEIANNILDQEPKEVYSNPQVQPDLPQDAFATDEPGVLTSFEEASTGFIVPDDLLFTGESSEQTIVQRNEVTEVKTAAELAAERKRLKKLEEEKLIREATKNTWLENYKHRDNVKRLYSSDNAATSISMQPRYGSSVSGVTHPPYESHSNRMGQKLSVPTYSGNQPQMSAQYAGPVLPKPTRIPSPESVAAKRVGTTQGDKKPLQLKASLSSSPEDAERTKKSDQEEDSGFSSVNVSADSQDTWNNRPITAKNRLFDEILEEELRKSGEVGPAYTPSGMIPKKPFVPLKKGTGKMAYNSNRAPNNQKRRKGRKKRQGRDQADGEGGGVEMSYEYEYEDDFEDYVESEPDDEEYDDSAVHLEDSQDVENVDPMAVRASKNNPENRPLMFVDAYSPSVKAKKINNMRSQCISKMGQKNFNKVYKFLHNARERGLDEGKIREHLLSLHSSADDNFLVDQLIFLESTSN